MENNNDQLVIVSDAWFNTDFIKKIKSGTKLIINGKYKLTQEDYKNILLYTNIKEVEVYDSVNVNYNGEIKIKISKNVDFRNESYQKLKINKIDGYVKKSLTLSPIFGDDADFNKLLDYIYDIELLNIDIENIVINKAIEIIYRIEKKIGKKIKFINIITQNKTIDEIEKLRFLEDGRIIKIWYEDGITDCSVDEFIVMRKNIDKIVDEIKQKQLSNLEKIIYAYDIVKKYNYKGSNSMDGRQLHKIFTTDNIVCSGYARIISQVLEELGIRSGIYKLITKDNNLHARSFVHIVDEKYNVNALYSMEPTWESKLNQEYSYTMFLTPISKLKQTFPNEIFREDISVLCGEKKLSEISLRDRISLYKFFKNKDLTQFEIDSLLITANKEVTLNSFCEALINVKSSKGINKNIIQFNVPEIINYNNKLIKYINDNIGTKIEFFK